MTNGAMNSVMDTHADHVIRGWYRSKVLA